MATPGSDPPTPDKLRVAMPSSDSAQLIRRLLEKELSKVSKDIMELMEDGHSADSIQVGHRMNRRRKVERAIDEIRPIQSFWHQRRLWEERRQQSQN